MHSCNRWWGVGIVAIVLVQTSLAGCAPKQRIHALNVEIDRSDQLKARTVRVDLVGLSDIEKAEWEAIPSKDYWDPRNPYRRNARIEGFLYESVLRAGSDSSVIVLDRNDPIWRTWTARNVLHLMVMADNLPGQHRKVLPLARGRWEQDIKLRLRDRQILLLTTPLPAK